MCVCISLCRIDCLFQFFSSSPFFVIDPLFCCRANFFFSYLSGTFRWRWIVWLGYDLFFLSFGGLKFHTQFARSLQKLTLTVWRHKSISGSTNNHSWWFNWAISRWHWKLYGTYLSNRQTSGKKREEKVKKNWMKKNTHKDSINFII